jgi:hypothetical protein
LSDETKTQTAELGIHCGSIPATKQAHPHAARSGCLGGLKAGEKALTIAQSAKLGQRQLKGTDKQGALESDVAQAWKAILR